MSITSTVGRRSLLGASALAVAGAGGINAPGRVRSKETT